MSAQVQPPLTPEQYLQFDCAAESRNEYYHGRMYAMSGGSFRHALIISNISAALRMAVGKNRCKVVTSDLRVRVAAEGLYTYPDIVAVCGEPEFAMGTGETLVNPILLGEVLLRSTEAYDRGFKAAQYRVVTSLREYLLISQDEPRIELVRRAEDGWQLLDFVGLGSVCHLNSVGCEVALADVYEGIVFGGSEEAAG